MNNQSNTKVDMLREIIDRWKIPTTPAVLAAIETSIREMHAVKIEATKDQAQNLFDECSVWEDRPGTPFATHFRGARDGRQWEIVAIVPANWQEQLSHDASWLAYSEWK